jgi:hypothetical protein
MALPWAGSCKARCIIGVNDNPTYYDDKTYPGGVKGSDVSPHIVIAASAEIRGEHLVYLRLDGSLAALFMLEIVESWFRI